MSLIMSSNWLRSLNESPLAVFYAEIVVRILLVVAFIYAEYMVAEMHVIQHEDMWRYRYPYIDSRVPFWDLSITIVAVSFVVFYCLASPTHFQGCAEFGPAVLGFSSSLLVTGVFTNYLKAFVGRPRPNYLSRCYGPTNYLHIKDPSNPCIQNEDWVGDMRKSFPSGHSSTSFAGLGYLSLYIAGKLGTFNSRGRGCIWKLVVSSLPLFLASWVASTRFTDYHHHADDILVGSLLGCIIAYTSYRIYYPSLTEEFSQYPYKWLDLGILQNDAQSEVVARNSRLSDSRLRIHSPSGSHQPLFGAEMVSLQADHTLLHTVKNGSNVNITLFIENLPTNLSTIRSEKSSIDFYWNKNDFDENHTPLVTQEDVQVIRQELDVALSKINHPSYSYVDVNVNGRTNME